MKGILVKPDLIPAIVDRRKTQTRRVIKPQPAEGIAIASFEANGETLWTYCNYDGEQIAGKCPVPRYHAGETVYIKEAWRVMASDDNCPLCDIRSENSCLVQYKNGAPSPTDCIMGRWRSPLFMPESAARHFITILAVWAERLQEITEEDAKAEGSMYLRSYNYPEYIEGFRGWFKELWDSINPKYPFESNPWVFPYEFEFVKER